MPHVERLTRLRTILENGVETNKHYNVAWWASCVSGWALQDGTFMKDGLRNDSNIPHYKRFEGFEALGKFFRLTKQDTNYLFGRPQVGPQSAQTAISRIDMLLFKQGKLLIWLPGWFGWRR